MSTMKNVRVTASDHVHKPMKLTDKQWLVYYYLMSICKWNGKEQEHHYYIYKNQLNVSFASKLLSISRTTFYKGMEILTDLGVITNEDSYYIVQIPRVYAAVDQKTITYLLQYQKYLGVELIRAYVILNRIYQHQELDQWFNKATLVSILDHNYNDTSYYPQIELFLGFFEYWGLINYEIEKKKTNVGVIKYYKIKEIHNIEEVSDFEIEVAAPVNKEIVEKIKKEVLEQYC